MVADDSHSDVSLSNNSVGVPLEQSSPDSDSILMPYGPLHKPYIEHFMVALYKHQTYVFHSKDRL